MMNHPPYSAEDLRDPPLPGAEFLQLLATQRQERYPEPPPFYQALFDGSLKREFLELWVKNMYYYWDYGLQFSTGAIFVKTNEEATRTHMLRKMVCIEGREIVNDLVGWTTPAYEELWLRFGEGIGLSRDEITEWKPFTRSYYAMSTLSLCSRWWEWSWLDGVASFYAGDQLGKELMSRAGDALARALQRGRAAPGDLPRVCERRERRHSMGGRLSGAVGLHYRKAAHCLARIPVSAGYRVPVRSAALCGVDWRTVTVAGAVGSRSHQHQSVVDLPGLERHESM